MKKIILILALMIVAIAANAATGQKFSKLDLSRCDVTLIFANRFDYVVEDANIKVTTAISDGTLKIAAEERFEKRTVTTYNNGDVVINNNETAKKVKVTIYMPTLTHLKLQNSSVKSDSKLSVDRLECDFTTASGATLIIDAKEIYAKLTAASGLTLDGKVKLIDVSLSSASRLSVDGEVDKITGSVGSASSINSCKLKAGSISLIVSSASKVNMTTNANDVNLKISSAASATLCGTANNLTASLTSVSKLNAGSFSVRSAEIHIDNLSDAKVNAKELIETRNKSNIENMYK